MRGDARRLNGEDGFRIPLHPTAIIGTPTAMSFAASDCHSGYKSLFDKSNNLADPLAYAELASQASIGCISGDLSCLPSSTFTGERKRESYHGTTSQRSEPFACNTPDESIEVGRAHGSGPVHNEHCGNTINPRGIHRTLP